MIDAVSSSNKNPVIYWFRQDLRLRDLPGLSAAVATGRPVLACYILDDESPGQWEPGAASRWWLHHSLTRLARDIEDVGGELYLARGRPDEILAELAKKSAADLVHCSRQYEPWARDLELSLHDYLAEQGIELKRYPGSLLWEPETVENQAGAPYKVFTPFWRSCRTRAVARAAGPIPHLAKWQGTLKTSARIGDWELLPVSPDWAKSWGELWQPGESGAARKLDLFLSGALADYGEGRDHPARRATSGLSPHLHYGEIAPATVFHAIQQTVALEPALEAEAEKFLSELGWREFSYHLLFHFPTITEQAFKSKFDAFPWLGGAQELKAWQQGQTGYPIVDAGMRELWQTGYMHNRVRMVAASFLCKHLLIDWRAGQRWFWDTLVDADLANNACGWQWVAGSGADASPYFRIFNPTTQGKKFDEEGAYVRRWVPEIATLPDRYLHQPCMAPKEVLDSSGITLGKTYPHPIVDHRDAREAALAAYSDIR